MLDQNVFFTAYQLNHVNPPIEAETAVAGLDNAFRFVADSRVSTGWQLGNNVKEATAVDTLSSRRILALNWRCAEDPQAGGSELNLFKQAEHWSNDGHAVTVFSAHPGKDIVSGYRHEQDGVNIIHIGSRFSVYIFAALYLIFFGYLFDHVLDISNGIPFFSRLFTRKPVTLLVHHVHGKQWHSEFPAPIARFGWFLESKVVPWVYRHTPVIVVSPTTYEAMLKIGYRADQMTIVYNGLDMPVLAEAEAVRAPRIAYVGRLKAYKRIDLLIEAVDQLRHTLPDVHLDIAGKGDVEDELMALVASRQLENHVTFHGFVSEETKLEILQNAAVFATASMHEGWGLSVLEANANGCPAVAFNVPGLCVSIRHQVTGLLAADDRTFVAYLSKVVSDPTLWRTLSHGARDWASEFDWGKSAAMTLRVMRNGIDKRYDSYARVGQLITSGM